jgi:hypothetical protein
MISFVRNDNELPKKELENIDAAPEYVTLRKTENELPTRANVLTEIPEAIFTKSSIEIAVAACMSARVDRADPNDPELRTENIGPPTDW